MIDSRYLEIQEILRRLGNVKTRKSMYLGDCRKDYFLIEVFLIGFYLGVNVRPKSLDGHWSIKKEVLTKRGWDPKNTLVGNQMLSSGMDHLAVIDEILEIEIETWKLLLERSANSELSESGQKV
ncbi:MAG: hypothetical protein R2684_14700 [Pyrinomonadaceae bacterium]